MIELVVIMVLYVLFFAVWIGKVLWYDPWRYNVRWRRWLASPERAKMLAREQRWREWFESTTYERLK